MPPKRQVIFRLQLGGRPGDAVRPPPPATREGLTPPTVLTIPLPKKEVAKVPEVSTPPDAGESSTEVADESKKVPTSPAFQICEVETTPEINPSGATNVPISPVSQESEVVPNSLASQVVDSDGALKIDVQEMAELEKMMAEFEKLVRESAMREEANASMEVPTSPNSQFSLVDGAPTINLGATTKEVIPSLSSQIFKADADGAPEVNAVSQEMAELEKMMAEFEKMVRESAMREEANASKEVPTSPNSQFSLVDGAPTINLGATTKEVIPSLSSQIFKADADGAPEVNAVSQIVEEKSEQVQVGEPEKCVSSSAEQVEEVKMAIAEESSTAAAHDEAEEKQIDPPAAPKDEEKLDAPKVEERQAEPDPDETEAVAEASTDKVEIAEEEAEGKIGAKGTEPESEAVDVVKEDYFQEDVKASESSDAVEEPTQGANSAEVTLDAENNPQEEANSAERVAQLEKMLREAALREEEASWAIENASKRERDVVEKEAYASWLIQQAENERQAARREIRDMEVICQRKIDETKQVMDRTVLNVVRTSQMKIEEAEQRATLRIEGAVEEAEHRASLRIEGAVQEALGLAEWRMMKAVRRLSEEFIARHR